MSLSSNIRIVCAVTSDLGAEDVTIPESELEGRFPPSERVQYLELEPLSAEGVVEWLERQPMVTLHKPAPVELDEIGKQIAAAFFDASGGNPNVLGLVIRDSYDHERRVSMDDNGHWRAKCDLETLRRSQSAEKLVRARVARLNSDEREILDISSVVGPEIDGDLLRRVSDRDLNEIDGLLRGARALGTSSTTRTGSNSSRPRRRDGRSIASSRPRSGPIGTRRSHLRFAIVRATARHSHPTCRSARHLSEVAAVHGRHAKDAAEHFLRAAQRAVRSDARNAVSLAHEALAVLDKFHLVDDSQLRAQANQIVADSRIEIRVSDAAAITGLEGG